MNRLLIVGFVFLVMISCQKEEITVGKAVSETFYLDNCEASMRVLVEGNTSGKTFIIFVHGGPGASSYIYHTDYISQNIENKYALVYWDERNAGASQGNSNGDDLNLAQMTNDLKKLVQLIKYRYGQDSRVFILGHSFGGLLTASFMTSENNQSLVKGWICVDGSHNYSLNDSLTRNMLVTVGQQQIALNKNINRWEPIIQYCKDYTTPLTYDESYQLNSYAEMAETYMDEIKIKVDYVALVKENAIKYDWPVSSILLNMEYSSNASFNYDLAKTEFSSKLGNITTPTLLLYGQYDFICPSGLGDEIYNRINTTDKKMVISPISGHNMMFEDKILFCKEINEFVECYQ
jgi:pimeloyl-ACP methyl ester carboxylesterase